MIDGMEWRLLSVVPEDSETGLPIEAVLLLPPPSMPEEAGEEEEEKEEEGRKKKEEVGLIVVPHGGPHSCTPTSFVASYAYLALETGCAVMHVNYRGSIGFGTPGEETKEANNDSLHSGTSTLSCCLCFLFRILLCSSTAPPLLQI